MTEQPNPLAEVQAMIEGVLSAFPVGRQRTAALKAVRWRLRGPVGQYVGLDAHFACSFVPEAEAFVFDGRDNEAMKLATYQTALGEQLTVEVLQ